MAEIHAYSAILNKQITKSMQDFSTCILWIWNRIYFFYHYYFPEVRAA